MGKKYIDTSKTPVYDLRIVGTPKGAKLQKGNPYYIQNNTSPFYEEVEYDKNQNAYKVKAYRNVYTKEKPEKNVKIIEGVNSSYVVK